VTSKVVINNHREQKNAIGKRGTVSCSHLQKVALASRAVLPLPYLSSLA